MKIEPRRAPSTAQHDDITPELEARAAPLVHRRTTVTVERETISVLLRRPAKAPGAEFEGGDIASALSHECLPEPSPNTPDDLAEDKP